MSRSAAVALSVAAGAVAAPVLLELVPLWMAVPYYTHAVLVPAFSAWLLWDLRRASRWSGAGAIPALAVTAFLVGLGVLLLGTAADSLTLRALALTPLAFAAALVLLPGASPRRLALPIGFLVLVTPLPDGALAALSLGLQHLAATVTAGVLFAAGVPHVHAGLFIHLDSVTVHVSEACNGLRFLFAMLTTGTAFAGLAVAGTRPRLIVVALAIAVAILANLVRVASTAFIAHAWGADAASGLPHIIYGKAVYVVALAVFVAAVLTLRRRERRNPPGPSLQPADVRAAAAGPRPDSAVVAGRGD